MAETVEAPHVWRGLPLMTGKHSFLGLFNVSENESKGRKNTTEAKLFYLPLTLSPTTRVPNQLGDIWGTLIVCVVRA